ncbi:MAG: hypothetical protein GF350_11380 [Chitinivibrionales bacterium]|nr:hypothetical protein [Chitinivibrionales bacterium]
MKHQTDRHVLGIPEMDEQHFYLYSLFDNIDNSESVTDAAFTKKLLEELDAYLLFHFTSEEHFIRMYKVPGFAEHKADHEQAGERFVLFQNDFENGVLNPSKLRKFLFSWLKEHSRTSDALYAEAVLKMRSRAL